jgi:small-conductance mechanosensitive channel
LLFDRLTDAIASNKVSRESLEESLLAVRDAVERASVDVAQRDRNSNQSESAKLELRLAQETLVLRRQELSIQQTRQSINHLELTINQRKRDIIAPEVVFSEEVIQSKNEELDAREVKIKQQADLLQSRVQFAERRWMEAHQRLNTTATPSPEMIQQVESLKLVEQTLRVAQGVNNQRIGRLPLMRKCWDRRYRLATGRSTRQQRQKWLAETVEQIEQFRRERRSRELALNETRVSLASTTSETEDEMSISNDHKHWLKIAAESLNEQSDLHNRAIIGIDSGKRALTRLQVEIEGEPSRSVREWIADSWAALRRGWNYELTRIDDTSLTVGRAVSSLLFIIFGYFAARWISRSIGRRLPKIGVNEAAAHAIESLSFYVLLLAFGLTALRYANVPLTVFTFLGGAVAIGVGFGSQNILNNFISGLILLAERPIKAGDLIVIDNTYGNVTQIGARSTQIRTGDNLDIIVPNSKFLENNVVNLTRLDDRLRTSIKIGVAYGSPLDQVMLLLKQAALDTPGVHSHPEPNVWFNDFGDNSLEFEVTFWLSVRSITQRKNCETLVRLSIDRILREHAISIAFPQRDLHLSSSQPIEFKMVADEKKQETNLRAAG